MNGRKAKALRRKVTGDPAMEGRLFARMEQNEDGTVKKSSKTFIRHPMSFRRQYQEAKKEAAK